MMTNRAPGKTETGTNTYIQNLAILPNQEDNFSGLAYVGEKDEEETMFISMPQVIFQLVLQIQIQFIQMKTSFFSKFQILNRGKSIVLELSIDLGRFHCTKELYGLCAGSLLGDHHNDLSGIR